MAQRLVRLTPAMVFVVLLAGGLAACGVPSTAPDLASPKVKVLCRGIIDAHCAARASAATSHVVAWIPVSTPQTSAYLLVHESGRVVESLRVGSIEVSLKSPPMDGDGRSHGRRFAWAGGSGSLRIERNPGLELMSLTWVRGTTRLSLDMIDAHADARVAKKIVGMVRYSVEQAK